MKIKGIKKTTSGMRVNTHLARRVYLNVTTREMCLNCYTSLNSWSEYHNPHIVNIYSVAAYPFGRRTITMRELAAYAEAYIDAYDSGDDDWRSTGEQKSYYLSYKFTFME